MQDMRSVVYLMLFTVVHIVPIVGTVMGWLFIVLENAPQEIWWPDKQCGQVLASYHYG